MTPQVSVVMSVYNGERYLRQSVDSILNQTLADLELIVIDDGSSDNSAEILESYRDSRLVVVKQENMGLTKSLNRGFSSARGRFLARQDVDDLSKPERLEKQVAFLEAHPQVGLLGTRFEFIDDNGTLLRLSPLPTNDEVLQERLIEINQFCHASVMLRREVVEEIGQYREFFRLAQDYDLWLRISERYKLANLPEYLVQYREWGSAISSEKILLQSRYACLAAQMAFQRRESGRDALERGELPKLPLVENFSDLLQRKMFDHYAQHPDEMVKNLADPELRDEMLVLVRNLWAERSTLQESLKQQTGHTEWYKSEVRKKDEQLAVKDQLIQARDEKVQELEEQRNLKDALMLQVHGQLGLKDDQILHKEERLRAKFDRITEKDEQLRAKDDQLAQKDEQLNAKDELLAQKDELLKAKFEQITLKDDALRAKDEQIAQKDEQLRVKLEQITLKDDELRAKDEQIAQKDEQLRMKFEQIILKDEALRAKDELIAQKDELLSAKFAHIILKDEQLRGKDEQLAFKDEQLGRKDAQIEERDARIQGRDEQIRQKDEEAEATRRELAATLSGLRELEEELSRAVAVWQSEKEQLERELRKKELLLEEILVSKSWRITAPFRKALECVRTK